MVLLNLSACTQELPKNFSREALDDNFVDLQGNTVTFENILEKYEGKKVVLDIWASWCRDCLEGLPEIKRLQSENPETVFVFLSLDRSNEAWKKGIINYQIKAEHYFMQTGWDGDFGDFVDLDWIPRYMVVDKDRNILLFKAVKATDENLIKALK